MAVGTIDSIKDYISKIDAQLIIFRKTMKENNSELDKALYGSESEYSLNALYAGIKNIYTDIKFLTSNECYYIVLPYKPNILLIHSILYFKLFAYICKFLYLYIINLADIYA